MSHFRTFLLIGLVSLSVSLGLFIIGSKIEYNEYNGGYAVLAYNDDSPVNDKILCSLLDDAKNYFSGEPVCESSQWVLLDEFDSLQMIPLDLFSNRVFSNDPRNDGYAEKLKNVFIRNGKRFVYIPLKAGTWFPSELDNQFQNQLRDISFSVNYFGIEKPFFIFFIIYAGAVLALLILCYVKKNKNSSAAGIISLMPVFFCFSFSGAPGIACAAVLLGLFVMLGEPVSELAGILWMKGSGRGMIYKDVIKPYSLYWLLFPLFMAALGAISFFSQIKFSFLLFTFTASCAVFFFSVRTMTLSGGSHRRFSPVLIIKRRMPDFAFSVYMLPFAAAAFLALLVTPFFSGNFISGDKFDCIIEEQDYFAHLSFQASFSMRQLSGSNAGYPVYMAGEDGLPVISEKTAASNPAARFDEYPPFPLKNLMDFLKDVNSGGNAPSGGGTVKDIFSLFILLIFILPGLLFKGKNNLRSRDDFEISKRFSLNLKWTDKNHKKVLLFNDKNNLRFRKDA